MTDNDDNIDSRALEHAWNWFEYHANQRMTMLRFYLIVDGAIAGGIGYLWKDKSFLLAALLGALGMVASFSFARLDYRVSHLLKFGEAALKRQQKLLADQTSNPDLEICEQAGANSTNSGVRLHMYPYTYGEAIRLLLGCAVVCFGIVLLAGVWKAKNP